MLALRILLPSSVKNILRSGWEKHLASSVIDDEGLSRLARRQRWEGIFSPPEEWEFRPNSGNYINPSSLPYVGRRSLPAGFCIGVEGVDLIGPKAAGLYRGKPILASVGGDPKVFLTRRGEVLGNQELEVLRRQLPVPFMPFPPLAFGDLIPLIPFHRNYFYHWMLEYLPKLQWLPAIRDLTGSDPHILIPTNPPPFVTESLALMGIKADRIIAWPGGRWRAHRVWMSHHHPHSAESQYRVSPRDIAWVKKTLSSAILSVGGQDSGDKDMPSMVYVSRQQARSGQGQRGLRRVRNFEELLPDLTSRGIKIVDFSAMSLNEQIRTAMNAKLFIGPHGAGLTHMIFSARASVIELFPARSPLPFFPLVAAAAGCPFTAVPTACLGGELVVSRESLLPVLDQVIEAAHAH